MRVYDLSNHDVGNFVGLGLSAEYRVLDNDFEFLALRACKKLEDYSFEGGYPYRRIVHEDFEVFTQASTIQRWLVAVLWGTYRDNHSVHVHRGSDAGAVCAFLRIRMSETEVLFAFIPRFDKQLQKDIESWYEISNNK